MNDGVAFVWMIALLIYVMPVLLAYRPHHRNEAHGLFVRLQSWDGILGVPGPAPAPCCGGALPATTL
jgi:hypothetical protein